MKCCYILYCDMLVLYLLDAANDFEVNDATPNLPRPIEIVKALPEHKFELNTEALEDILFSDEVRDKPVVVLSVAGAFRKGKSFLLDYFLRYLNFKVFVCQKEITFLIVYRNPIILMIIGWV